MTGHVRQAVGWHRPLMVFAGLMVVTGLVAGGGLLVDDRVLGGEAIWLKPLKFSVSLGVYALTWAWLLSLRPQRPWMWWASTAIAGLAGVEMVIIVGQVLRGRASHFNIASPLDSTLFTIMGVAITALWVLNMAQGAVLLRERLPDRAVEWAVRLGIVIGSVGIGLAFLMVGPGPDNLPDRVGAHSVGVPDGGPGMPVTGWSTVGGDLRIPHFVGIHAMQALPLLALALSAAARRLPRLAEEGVRVRLVWLAGGLYAGTVAVVTWQALRGQPLIRPDAWTLGALGLLVVAAVAGAARALSTSERREPVLAA